MDLVENHDSWLIGKSYCFPVFFWICYFLIDWSKMELKNSQFSEDESSWFGLWKSCQIFVLKEFFFCESWYIPKTIGCFWGVLSSEVWEAVQCFGPLGPCQCDCLKIVFSVGRNFAPASMEGLPHTISFQLEPLQICQFFKVNSPLVVMYARRLLKRRHFKAEWCAICAIFRIFLLFFFFGLVHDLWTCLVRNSQVKHCYQAFWVTSRLLFLGTFVELFCGWKHELGPDFGVTCIKAFFGRSLKL